MPNSTTNPPVEMPIRPINLGNWPVATATTGTDTTVAANTTLYYTSVFIPGNTTITGVKYLAGSASTNGNVFASIHDTGGTLLGSTLATATVATPTAAQTGLVPLATPLQITGPRHVLVGLSFSSTSDHLRTVPTYCDAGSGIFGGTVTLGTANTAATFTPSSTQFTGATAPIVSLY
jgi:hypothetical protein